MDPVGRRSALFGSAALVIVLGLAGCGEDGTTGEAQDATSGATRIAYSLEGPGNLTIVGTQLVWSTAHFDASGDPELDQQFASWRGALWRKPLAGGAKKKVDETVGAVTSTAVLGSKLLVVDSTYMGITSYSVTKGTSTDFYNDYSHFPDGSEELYSLGAVAAGPSGVYVTRPESEVMRIGIDGSSATVFAKTFKTGWLESAERIVVLPDAVVWSAQKQGDTGSTYNLYRASTEGSDATPKKLASFDAPITALATDGTDVFVAIATLRDEPGRIVVARGSAKPTTLVADQPHPDNMIWDARFGLFFSDWKGGVLLAPAKAIAEGAEVEPAVVIETSEVTSIAVGRDHLYVARDPGEINEKKGEILRWSLADVVPSR